MALGVARQQPAGRRQSTVIADSSKCVPEFAIFRSGITNAVRSQQRQIERAGNRDSGTVASFFFTMKMALQFDVDVAAAKNSNQMFDLLACSLDAAVL